MIQVGDKVRIVRPSRITFEGEEFDPTSYVGSVGTVSEIEELDGDTVALVTFDDPERDNRFELGVLERV